MIQTSELLSMTGLSQTGTTPLPIKENKLVNRMLKGDMRLAVKERARQMFQLNVSETELAKLALLAHGALSPLTGFMCQADYESVLFDMRLTTDEIWTMPLTLTVDEKTAVSIQTGQEIALCENGRVLAVLEVAEKFKIDKKTESALLYQTTDETHPGVQQTNTKKEIAIGGHIWVIDLPTAKHDAYNIQFTPAQTRRMFARRGWRRIVGYHPTSPIYRTHEYIQKNALELVDGLFILHSINNQSPFLHPAATNLLTYQTILQNYYPTANVLLGVYPGFLQSAGPRELLFWAQIHKNYGCTHFVVNNSTHSKNHLIFDNFTEEELGIIIMPFEETYFCTQCDMIVSQKTCPHGKETAVNYTDSQIQTLLKEGHTLKSEFIRPEVATLLSTLRE